MPTRTPNDPSALGRLVPPMLSTLALLSIIWTALPRSATAQGELTARRDDGDPTTMPLVEETLSVRIDRQHARTTLGQTYQNELGSQVEGRYLLRTDVAARVEGFAYWNGPEKVVGEVFEKESAREVYSEVTGFGRDPGLLEQTGEGEFDFRVFPIEPGEPKRVEVTFGQWLTQVGRSVVYRVPLRHRRPTIRVSLTEDRPVQAITSPTHALEVRRRGPSGAEIQVGAPTGAGDELVLRYELDVPDWQLAARVHRDPGHDPYLVLSLPVPEGAARRGTVPKDVTLVVDRSGSMGGAPLAQAKRAAADLVARLREGDRLNIVAFDDGFEALYPRPRAVDDGRRREAFAWVERIDGGGGTDIAGALRAALAAQHPVDPDRPQVVLFLTDGQSDPQAALAAAAGSRGTARIYTVGVGQGVQRPLLSRLARDHRGTFTFIPTASAIAERMGRLHRQLAAPVLVGPELRFDGARPHHRYPRTLPDLYAGDELVAAARLLQPGLTRVRLRGRVAGRPVAFETTVQVPEVVSAPWVARLWARKRVDDLLEEIALRGETDERKNEVIELALAYAFTTPYTSFLAIPEAEMTDAARAAVDDMRAERRRILEAHPDAAALSRSVMPPGDPVLRVRAPADARQVTAYFPFGLVRDLRLDPDGETWVTRFLVPNSVADGDYQVRVLVVDANGQARIADVPYTIESDPPEIEVEAEGTRDGARVVVTAPPGTRRAAVAWVDDPTVRVELTPLDGDATRGADERLRFVGVLPLPPGRQELRVVVADRGRNEAIDQVLVEVP